MRKHRREIRIKSSANLNTMAPLAVMSLVIILQPFEQNVTMSRRDIRQRILDELRQLFSIFLLGEQKQFRCRAKLLFFQFRVVTWKVLVETLQEVEHDNIVCLRFILKIPPFQSKRCADTVFRTHKVLLEVFQKSEDDGTAFVIFILCTASSQLKRRRRQFDYAQPLP